MKWISVEDELPVIPRGKYGVPVLVCTYDPVYDESEEDSTKSRGIGLSVSCVSYTNIDCFKMKLMPYWMDDGEHFTQLTTKGEWLPMSEQVTHWMYLPKPPKYNTRYNKEKDLLEFIYREEVSCPVVI